MASYTRRTTSVIPTSTGLRELQRNTVVPKIEPVESLVGVEAALDSANQLQRFASEKQNELLRAAEENDAREQRTLFVNKRAELQSAVSNAREAYLKNQTDYPTYLEAVSKIETDYASVFPEDSLEQAELNAAFTVASINDRAIVESTRRKRLDRQVQDSALNQGSDLVSSIRTYELPEEGDWSTYFKTVEEEKEIIITRVESSGLDLAQQGEIKKAVSIDVAEALVSRFTEAGQYPLASRVVENEPLFTGPRAAALLKQIKIADNQTRVDAFESEAIAIVDPTSTAPMAQRLSELVSLRENITNSNLNESFENSALRSVDKLIVNVQKNMFENRKLFSGLDPTALSIKAEDYMSLYSLQSDQFSNSGEMDSLIAKRNSILQRTRGALDEEDAFNHALIQGNHIPDPGWMADLGFDSLNAESIDDRVNAAKILITAIQSPGVTPQRRALYVNMASQGDSRFKTLYTDSGIADYSETFGTSYDSRIVDERLRDAIIKHPSNLSREELKALNDETAMRGVITNTFPPSLTDDAAEKIVDAWQDLYPDQSLSRANVSQIYNMSLYGDIPLSLLKDPPRNLEDIANIWTQRLPNIVAGFAEQQSLISTGQSQLVTNPGFPPARDPFVTQYENLSEYDSEEFSSYGPWQAQASLSILGQMDHGRVKVNDFTIGLDQDRSLALSDFVSDLNSTPAFGNRSHWENRIAYSRVEDQTQLGIPLRPETKEYWSQILEFQKKYDLSPSQVSDLFSSDGVPQPQVVLRVFAETIGDNPDPYINEMFRSQGSSVRVREGEVNEIIFNFNPNAPGFVFPEITGSKESSGIFTASQALPQIRVDPDISQMFSEHWDRPLVDPDVQDHKVKSDAVKFLEWMSEDKEEFREFLDAIEGSVDYGARAVMPFGVLPIAMRPHPTKGWEGTPLEEVSGNIWSSIFDSLKAHSKLDKVKILKSMPPGTLRNILLKRKGESISSDFEYSFDYSKIGVLESMPEGTLRNIALERERRKKNDE